MKSPCYPYLPPLSSLLIFEAAARHESFAHAADELCLSASAVAHQIKKLESSLGLILFIRHPRGVSLSPQSHDYLKQVQHSLKLLDQHSAQIRNYNLYPLRIVTQHAIAQLWLQPRLGHYHDRHSDHELEITARSRIDVPEAGADIVIGYFADPPTENRWQPLWAETLLPVCHPAYQRQNAVLYQDAHWSDDWEYWRQQWPADSPLRQSSPFSRVRSASLYALILQSVLDKQGVMIARKTLVKAHLDQGDLIPWPGAANQPIQRGAYYLYQSPASMNNPFANHFRRWLLEQAELV